VTNITVECLGSLSVTAVTGSGCNSSKCGNHGHQPLFSVIPVLKSPDREKYNASHKG
jgi:hypothetical protein